MDAIIIRKLHESCILYSCVFCGICGRNVNIMFPHIAKHTNGFPRDTDNIGYPMLIGGGGRIKMQYCELFDLFPQLSLIESTNKKLLVESMFEPVFDTFCGLDSRFSGMVYLNLDGVHSDRFVEEKIIKIISKWNYYCGLCGKHYESGIPDVEIAVRHVMDCVTESGALLHGLRRDPPKEDHSTRQAD